jgi:hypothetical protein
MSGQLLIGKLMPPMGWAVSKKFGDTGLFGSQVRCEAFGADWAIFRDESGKPMAIVCREFSGAIQMKEFLENWGD